MAGNALPSCNFKGTNHARNHLFGSSDQSGVEVAQSHSRSAAFKAVAAESPDKSWDA